MVMALADALHSLLRLPGATYSCVVERDSGRVLAEVGSGEAASGDSEGVVPYSVPRWGTAVAAMFDSTSGDELDDVMITGRRSYHLVRPIGPGASVLVYLRLDRSRSNLAAARRELATVRLGGGAAPATTPAVPAARSGSDAAVPAARSRSDAVPATRSRSDATTPGSQSRTETAAPAARSRPVAATAPAPPARVPAALAPPSTPARGLRRTGAPTPSGVTGAGSSRSSSDADASGTAAPPAARSAGSRSSASRSAGSRSSGSRSGSPSGSPSGSSSSGDTPVGRARPDTTRQIPLPRRASTRSASDAGPVRQRSEAGPVGSVDAPGEPAPEGFAMPAVLGQSWARDPGTLRRLIAGLRRMT